MTDQEKLTAAITALKVVAAQERHLRQGGCDMLLDFDGLESGLTLAVDAAQTALVFIAPPNAAVKPRSEAESGIATHDEPQKLWHDVRPSARKCRRECPASED